MDNPYNQLCPECGTPAVGRCRCPLGNFHCANGHEWHFCPVHHCVNPGTGHGSGGKCTCKEKEASVLYHGSAVPGLKELKPEKSRALGGEEAVFTTPDKELALTFGAPWRDDDFAQGYINNEPYMQEQYPGAFDKIYKGRTGYIYSVKDEGFKSDPRLMRKERIRADRIPTESVEVIQDLLAALRKTRFKLLRHGEKQADSVYSYVPQEALPMVRRYGLLGGKALIQRPDALAAAASGRGTTPDDFRTGVEKILASWKKYQALGPNVFFQPPHEGVKLPQNHPFKQHNLAPITINLKQLLKDVPKTRVHGMELEPYDEKKHYRANQRHHYLNKRKKLRELLNTSAEDLWKDYADPEGKGYYAANVPHASVHTPDGIVPLKYLTLPKEAASAKGIPDRKDYGDLSKLPVGRLIDWIVQRHIADKAGPHSDIRLGDPNLGLYSWAARKGLPTPGRKHLAVQQPLHSHAYGAFEGEIPEGYGKGTVKKDDEGKVLLTKVEPNKLHFTVAHRRYPERYVLFKPPGGLGKKEENWLLMNTTPVDPLKYDKLRYKSVSADKVEPLLEKIQPGTSVQAKLDGALTLTNLLKDKIELLSYRKSKVHGGPILHTERVFHTIPHVNVPKEYQGSVLSGELYGTEKGQAIEPQVLGGLLNSSIAKSIPAQEQLGVKFRNQLFDIRRLGKKDISNETTPYGERLSHIRRILDSIAGPDSGTVKQVYHAPESAETPEAAKKLYQQIAGGQHPGTTEGIVIHPPLGTPTKSKLFDEHDVHIRGVFPGKGKYEGKGIGGFIYSHEPKGQIAGEVGTGLSDELRTAMFDNPNDYIGRQARVRATRKLPGGALFQPSLLALHEDYPLATKRNT